MAIYFKKIATHWTSLSFSRRSLLHGIGWCLLVSTRNSKHFVERAIVAVTLQIYIRKVHRLNLEQDAEYSDKKFAFLFHTPYKQISEFCL
jgi:hypothetical protein